MAGAIAGAAGGGIVSSLINVAGQAAATAVAVREAKKQRNWAERMRNDMHQAEVRDLKKAGLNPILSTKHGGSSPPSPSGAARPSQGQTGDPVGTAISLRRLKSEMNLLDQKAKTETEQQANLRDLRVQRGFQNAQSVATTGKQLTENKLLQSAVPGAKVEEEIDTSIFGEVTRYLQRLNPLGGTARKLRNK